MVCRVGQRAGNLGARRLPARRDSRGNRTEIAFPHLLRTVRRSWFRCMSKQEGSTRKSPRQQQQVRRGWETPASRGRSTGFIPSPPDRPRFFRNQKSEISGQKVLICLC